MLTLPLILSVLQVSALVTGALAALKSRSSGALLVTTDYGTFQGFPSAGDTESFLGMPFAQPPVGQLRFNKPLPPEPFSGVRYATNFGNACPQQIPAEFNGTDNPTLSKVIQFLGQFLDGEQATDASEDCLYLNVVRPAGVSEGENLPVVAWIYGGAFETGFASGYNGTQIVSRSIALKSPVIYVSFNYRLNAFGFLGGKEVQAAGLGNFGLHDQRLALKWVQKYIHLFGGNERQVILWGESAGSMSIMFQMVAYDGRLNGLFQGVLMESDSVISSFDVTSQSAQDGYDFLVEQTNCTAANDTLACLRLAPYESVQNAVQKTPSIFSYQQHSLWGPHIDGVFLKQSSRKSLSQGKYAQAESVSTAVFLLLNSRQVPAILGDVDDEGTMFALSSLNVTTNDLFLEYMRTNVLVGATEEEMQKVAMLYPEDPTLGSPFGVGTNDTLTPQYKRIAAFQGDLIFQAPRRYALHHLSCTQDVWSYLWKRNKQTPILGSFHGSDLQEFYNLTGSSDWVGTDALVNFAYTLNPNVPTSGYPSAAAPSLLENVRWPQYKRQKPLLLTFEDPNVLTLTNDTFRAKQFETLDEIQNRLGL